MPEAKLYHKLANVIGAVEQVEKRGHNAHFNYDYATAEDILRLLRSPLAEQNIALLCSVSSINERAYKTARGNESTITTVHVDFEFVDGDTGEKHSCSWAGQGDDPADKGLGKAYTNAVKTFLRQSFLLPQGDDPEADGEADKRSQERQSSGRRQVNGRAGRPSDAQKGFIEKLVKEKGATVEQLQVILNTIGADIAVEPGWLDKLSGGKEGTASELITFLKEHPLPSIEHPSDVPGAEPGEFEHPDEDPKGTPMELHG